MTTDTAYFLEGFEGSFNSVCFEKTGGASDE
jgi:hypothetical protein